MSRILYQQMKQLVSNDLRMLLESIGVIKNMEANQYLFHQGMPAKEIYLIQSGIVQINMLSANGEELSLRICKQNDIIGELTLFTDKPTFLLNAKIIEAGEVLAINIDTLQKELMTNIPLANEMMKWVSNHMRKLQLKLRDLLLNGKKGALYSTLIRLSNSYGVQHNNGILIDIVFTHQELAKFCGATREYVNRMLGQLRKSGVISVDSTGKIVIQELQYLKHENGCENCPVEICNMD